MGRLLVLVLLGACAGTPADQGATLSNPSDGEEEPVNTVQPPEAGRRDLSVRLELTQDTIERAGELSGHLYVRNHRDEPRVLEFLTPAGFDLEWTLTATDGTVYLPTFLPPPMPLPGGPPRSTVSLDANAESPIAHLGALSGFFKRGDPVETWGPLPAGRYELVLTGIRLDDGAPLSTSPVVLIAR